MQENVVKLPKNYIYLKDKADANVFGNFIRILL